MSDEAPAKVASRPGSMWAHGKRTKQEAFKSTPGYVRGCRVKQSTKPATSEKTAK